MSDSWEGYESGPFCRHWGDPADCDDLCVCGHKCCEHAQPDGSFPTECSMCDCSEWREQE